eukprot:TRINITY_DN1080_c0_g2_i2.p1 TRINITY_DN1080_c0_g2~~TRINITY_DN1080_c0_g2_i2.p1  ORF type:complete len:161 (-),score=21.87 TRINITY_DN1080_c0_g2_i2:33-515(-)
MSHNFLKPFAEVLTKKPLLSALAIGAGTWFIGALHAWVQVRRILGPWKYLSWDDLENVTPITPSSSSSGKKPQVLVSGAGLAGTLLALMLAQKGFDVLVIERRQRNSEGSHVVGINLDMRTLRLLRKVGFSMDDLRASGTFLTDGLLYVCLLYTSPSPRD